MPAHNMQFRKRRFSWLFEAFCPATSFVTVDNDDTRIPPHAILPDVAYYPVINPKKTGWLNLSEALVQGAGWRGGNGYRSL